GERRELREAVVLADEHDRQPPERGEVQGLVEGAGLRRAVAEERDRDRAAQTADRGRAERERDVSRDDAGRSHEADVRRRDVHRPALAATVARRASGELGEQARRVGALRERVSVRAVAAVDQVVAAKNRAGAGGDRLLPDPEVEESAELSL